MEKNNIRSHMSILVRLNDNTFRQFQTGDTVPLNKTKEVHLGI
jgi:hypothetical protein